MKLEIIITTRCINFTSNNYAAIAIYMYVVFYYTYQIVEKEKTQTYLFNSKDRILNAYARNTMFIRRINATEKDIEKRHE